MIKNIVFDMGNVLLDYNPNVILDKVCENEAEKEIIFHELYGEKNGFREIEERLPMPKGLMVSAKEYLNIYTIN